MEEVPRPPGTNVMSSFVAATATPFVGSVGCKADSDDKVCVCVCVCVCEGVFMLSYLLVYMLHVSI